MKRNLMVVFVALLMMAALVAGSAAASEKANKPVTCDLEIELADYGPPPYWFGEVSNCEFEGFVFQFVTGAKFVGNTEHWVGYEVILYGDDEVIVIEEKGIYTFSNFKYTTNGTVVAELPEIPGFGPFFTTDEDLIGAKTHGKGMTWEWDTSMPPPLNLDAWQTLRFH